MGAPTDFPNDWPVRGHEFETQVPQYNPVPNLGGRDPNSQPRAPGRAPSYGVAVRGNFSQFQFELLNATNGQVEFIPIVGTVTTTTPILARPRENRTYCIIQNVSAAASLIVSFGYQPSSSPVTGLVLAPNGGSYEPFKIPQGDIWLLGSGGTASFVMYVSQAG